RARETDSEEAESEDNIEIARGFEAEDGSLPNDFDREIELVLDEDMLKKESDIDKVLYFVKNLIERPAWARSLAFVKFDAARCSVTVPKEIQCKCVCQGCFVGIRRRCMMNYTRKAFESDDVPLQKSLLRLYCKNSVTGLRPLLRAILVASSFMPSIIVKYFEAGRANPQRHKNWREDIGFDFAERI
ncbi:hypothetical protein GCK32_000866, partial [Trichostrongylus colubriformis]